MKPASGCCQPGNPETARKAPLILDMTRRQFLKASAGLGVAAVLVASGLSRAVQGDLPAFVGRRWIMVLDLARCDGCKICTWACQDEHFVPFGQQWITVYKEENALGGKYPLPRPCMNCVNAPCVNVCPVRATYHNAEGIVLIDHERCIGCRMCMAACPYQARSFNWARPEHTEKELAHAYSPEAPWPHRVGVVEKCMFCAHRLKEGRLPACVDACRKEMEGKGSTGIIYFGDANEGVVSNGSETLLLSKLLGERQAYRLMEELGTKPTVIYLPR